MASLLESDVVNYVCDCGHLNPVSKLYFCRYCLKLRCGYCVCSQVGISIYIYIKNILKSLISSCRAGGLLLLQ